MEEDECQKPRSRAVFLEEEPGPRKLSASGRGEVQFKLVDVERYFFFWKSCPHPACNRDGQLLKRLFPVLLTYCVPRYPLLPGESCKGCKAARVLLKPPQVGILAYVIDNTGIAIGSLGG